MIRCLQCQALRQPFRATILLSGALKEATAKLALENEIDSLIADGAYHCIRSLLARSIVNGIVDRSTALKSSVHMITHSAHLITVLAPKEMRGQVVPITRSA